MKKLLVQVLATGALMVSTQVANAAAVYDDLICEGGGFKVSASYIVSVTDNAHVQLKIEKNNKTILKVSTEGDEGSSVNFIHNAFTGKSMVDENGDILHYGNGFAPTRLMSFVSEDGSVPKLMEVNLEANTLSADQKVIANLKCKSVTQ